MSAERHSAADCPLPGRCLAVHVRPEGDDPADDVIAASEYRDPCRDSNRDLREWLGRDPTDEEIADWIRRGFTDVIAESIGDGIEREPEANRWVGGDSYARVLDFGAVFEGGRTLRITVELVRAADPPDMPPTTEE